MKILLTGSHGCLGRAVRRMGGDKHTFVLLTPEAEPEDKTLSIDTIFYGSVTDRDLVFRALKGCEAVIHCAAMHGASKGRQPHRAFIETNVTGTENLLAGAVENGVRRFVFASTMEILIGADWKAYGTTFLDETLPIRPTWIYPVTKAQCEVMGSFYARAYGIEWASLRYMAFFPLPWEQLNLRLLARTLSDNDAARATLLAAETPGVKDEIFHIGPETPLTQADIQRALADPYQVLETYWPGSSDILAKQKLTPAPTHFWPVTRITKAKLMLGWQPLETFEAFLKNLGWKPS